MDSRNREVVDGLALSFGREPPDGGLAAAGRQQGVIAVQLVRSLPLSVCFVPERMVLGRDELVPIDLKFDDLVFVDPEPSDFTGASFIGFRIGGENLVADLDLADGFGGAVGHEDRGVTGETAVCSGQLESERVEVADRSAAALCGVFAQRLQ